MTEKETSLLLIIDLRKNTIVNFVQSSVKCLMEYLSIYLINIIVVNVILSRLDREQRMEDIKVRRGEIKKLRDLEEKEDKMRLQKAQREREDQEEKRKRYIIEESISVELNAEILKKLI